MSSFSRERRRLSAHALAAAIHQICPALQLEGVELCPEGFLIRWAGRELHREEKRQVEALWHQLLEQPVEIREMVPVSAAGFLRSRGQERLAARVARWPVPLLALVYDTPWESGADCPEQAGGVTHIWSWGEGEVRGDWWESGEERARVVKARRSLKANGQQRAERLALWDEAGCWLPRGVVLVRAFVAWWEALQADVAWVAVPSDPPWQGHRQLMERCGPRLAQWGDLFDVHGSWIVATSVLCDSEQLTDELVARLQSIFNATRILGLECSALVQASSNPKILTPIQRALQRAGVVCESQEIQHGATVPTIILLLQDRFGRQFEGPQLRLHSDVSMGIEESWQGSLSTLVALLLEQGELPFFLAPEQVWLVPVADGDLEQAADYRRQCAAAGLRAVMQPCSTPLGQRIAAAAAWEIPHVLVVGEREREAGTVSVRRRGEQSQIPFKDWLVTEERRVAHQ